MVGYVTVNANGGNGNDLIMGLSTGKDTLLGGDGNDVISGGFTTGINGSANVRVLDTPGIDSIRGGKGSDYIVASALAVVHGDEDDDVIRGDTTLYAVKDILIGGKGNDKLLGGAANDVYQYALGDGNDNAASYLKAA